MNTQMVRTTVYLPADLVARAKIYAIKTGTTLSGLMRTLLEEKLKIKPKSRKD